MSTPGETMPLQKEEQRSSFYILIHMTCIARTWGFITAAAMWAAIAVMIDHHKKGFLVYYLIGTAIFVSFFEITWVLNKCACCGQDGCCCRVWRAIMWIDNWKKFFLYVTIPLPLFLEGKKEALGIGCGFMLIILSTMYLVKTFSYDRVSISSYSKIEKTQTSSSSVTRHVISHEIATQTEGEDGQSGAQNPFDE